jgi:Leucine-rich repeat (LRR) protein
MKKYTVDYSEFSHFKGITIEFNYLKEGINYAQKHNIKDILVRSEENKVKQVVNFDFLKGLDFIETFHWIVSLSKKSDITGLYHLPKLKKLRWGVDNDFVLDLSCFPLLENINIQYSAKIGGWEALNQLKRVLISGVKTDNLNFLKDTTSLEYLRIIRGSFTSIAGIENLSNLKTLFLQICSSLTELKPTILNLHNLEQLNLEGCRKVDVKEQLNGVNIKRISVI